MPHPRPAAPAAPVRGDAVLGGRKQYSNADKATALAALAANGGNVKATALALGIPRTTLARWSQGQRISEGVSNQAHLKKGELADRLELIAQELADAMSAKIKKATLQQVATSLGIAIDKMQLLRGESTANDKTTIKVIYEDARADA